VVAFVLMPLALIWYIAVLPAGARFIVTGGAPVVAMFAGASMAVSAVILVFGWYGARSSPKQVSPAFAVLLLLMGFVATGTTEWVREAARKPYIIYDYMYSNSMRVTDVAQTQRDGVVRAAKWMAPDAPGSLGRKVYVLQCLCCHEVDGYNPVRPLVKGWSEDFLDYQLTRLNMLKGFMPPFCGNAAERQALAQYLATLNATGLEARR
jgi:mono/diheme cytochrome c family protein